MRRALVLAAVLAPLAVPAAAGAQARTTGPTPIAAHGDVVAWSAPAPARAL